MAYIPSSGSVVAFQSDITKLQTSASVAGAVQIAGNSPASIAGVQRLDVQVQGSTMGLVTHAVVHGLTAAGGGSYVDVKVDPSGALVTALGSVVAFQGTSPWVVNQPSPSIIAYQLAGSVLATSTTVNTGNSSVSQVGQWNVNAGSIVGTYQEKASAGIASALGQVMLFKNNTTTSTLAAVSNIDPLPVQGSVTVLQGTNPWNVNMPSPSVIAYQLAGSVMQVTGGGGGTQYTENNASTPSVVGNAILYKKDETNSVLSAVSPQHPLPVQGSVTALQGTNPWVISNPSVTAFMGGAWTTSVVGTVTVAQGGNAGLGSRWPVILTNGTQTVDVSASSQLSVAVNNTPTVNQGTSPWVINQPSPSIIAYQLAGSVMQVTGGGGGTQYTENNASTPSVVGNAILYKKDETNSVLSAVSPQHPLPVQGSVTALQGTNPWNINNSSVTAIQGGTWGASVTGTLSVLGTVPVTQSTTPWIMGSILGTYADNSAWAEGNNGVYALGVRNDTMSSVSAADVRYSPITVGPIGENITANAPITKWISGINSVFTTSSVQVIAPQGSSIFTYITGIQVVNASANNVYVTFTGGLGGISSTLGYTAAPANGGSNIVLPNAWKTGANSGFSASISGTASVYLTAEGFISKT